MDAVQNGGAANVAKAAAAAGVTSFVHLSAIGADIQSPSRYGRSKGQGEAAVRAAFPTAVIFRPSLIFGREDQFINRFAALIRLLPIVPVIAGATRFQPVYVGDVAQAVLAAISSANGKTYELGGPDVMTMAEVNRWIASRTGRSKTFVAVPNAMASLMARLTGWLPGAPMTWDQWLMLGKDNVVSDSAEGLRALSIVPTPLDIVARDWLKMYRKHGRFSIGSPA
jgi:uncharacterized protein YbjT (DUF2867 family)